NLYVLDIVRKQCVGLLHTGHPSGSLRSEPIIVDRLDAVVLAGASLWPPYLVLTQDDGPDQVKLRVFSLPVTNPDAASLLNPEPHVSGWSWFSPYFDAEKIAFATDRGVLGLFGVNQVHNDDNP